MTKMKLLLSINTEKYLDFLLVYTSQKNQKQNVFIILYSADFVKKSVFLIFSLFLKLAL